MKRAPTFILIFCLLSSCAPAPYVERVDLVGAHPRVTEQISISERVSLEVPFTVQAPFADWDDPYQEACEEASLLMVHSYLSEEELTDERANGELLALIAWETAHGYPQDITLSQLAEIAASYYGYSAQIIDNPSAKGIEEHIANGHPVIVPAAGRLLGNPYFSGAGPWYHMLVITGYDGKRFITNDPGTRRGEDYTYDYDVLLNAIHDWTGVKEEITDGEKRVLVFQRTLQDD